MKVFKMTSNPVVEVASVEDESSTLVDRIELLVNK